MLQDQGKKIQSTTTTKTIPIGVDTSRLGTAYRLYLYYF